MTLYIQEVDDLVNNRVRNKLGTHDSNGNEIVLPLTVDGQPPIDEELKAIATDLVIGKFRLQTSEKSLIWDTATKNLDNYLDRRFGYTRNIPFRHIPLVTLDPAFGPPIQVVSMDAGSGWVPNSLLRVTVDGVQVITTPAQALTDGNGRFDGIEFTIPASSIVDEISVIIITDRKNYKEIKYTREEEFEEADRLVTEDEMLTLLENANIPPPGKIFFEQKTWNTTPIDEAIYGSRSILRFTFRQVLSTTGAGIVGAYNSFELDSSGLGSPLSGPLSNQILRLTDVSGVTVDSHSIDTGQVQYDPRELVEGELQITYESTPSILLDHI